MPETAPLQLVLFVRGNAARSVNAIRVVRQVVGSRRQGAQSLRVVDVSQQPGLATQYGVIATPTLVRTGRGPERRLVGELSEQRVLDCFEVENDAH
jgi:circadian clock protein KaiB